MGSSPTQNVVLHINLKLILPKTLTNSNEKEINDLEPPPIFQNVIPIEEDIQNGNNIHIEKEINIEKENNKVPPKNNNNAKKEKPLEENKDMSLFNKENIEGIIKNNENKNINNENKKSYTNEINNPQEENKDKTKFGEEEDLKENPNISQTPPGENKDINLPNNANINQNNNINNNNITPTFDGNIDNNIGSNHQNFQYDDDNLGKSVIIKVENLEQSMEFIQKGYIPLFLKLNNCKPLYFFIKEESTLKSLIKAYLENNPKAKEGLENDIKLYNGNSYLDLNKPIKELKLDLYSTISDKIEDNNKGNN